MTPIPSTLRLVDIKGVSVPSHRLCPTCGKVAHLTGRDSSYYIYTCEGCERQPLVRHKEIRECPVMRWAR